MAYAAQCLITTTTPFRVQTVIAPEERYNQHSHSFDNQLLQRALAYFNAECAVKLAGGFQNNNYLIECRDGNKFVLRFYSTDNATAMRETNLLRLLKSYELCVPEAWTVEIDQRVIVALEFKEGELLQNILRAHVSCDLFYNVGVTLGKIHHVKFSKSGLFSADLQVGQQIDALAFSQDILNRLPETRLDKNICARTLKLLEDKWPLVVETEPMLVHCDFNPKNILVLPNGQISAVLDWEFAMSGNGFIDFGNFFRFPYDYPDYAQMEFIKGYESICGPIHPHWQEVAMLLDITSMCSFLDSKENHQRTFRTAREVLHSTLAYFDY